ncbi:MAG: S8 family serine peptidase [Gemmatimonadaceae bacterium]
MIDASPHASGGPMIQRSLSRPLARFARISRIALVAPLLMLLTPSGAQAQSPSSDPARRPFLFKDARGEVAAARARGDTTVTLVVASMPGQNARAAALVKQLGGTIGYRDDDVDYLRVRLPVDGVDKLVGHALIHSADVSISRLSRALGLAGGEPAAGADGLAAARASSPAAMPETLPFATPFATPFAAPFATPFATLSAAPFARDVVSIADTTKKRWPPPLPETPLVDRYDPVSDMGGTEWRRLNPTFDGRGTGVAIIDQSLDALLPELRVAITIDGKPTQKIVGYMTAVDIEEENDGQWLRMNDAVTPGAGGTFTYKDSAYTAPAAGPYRIAVLNEAVFDSLNRAGLEKDLNRDGNPKGSSRLFAVLWNEATGEVWLDTNQDRDFRDEQAFVDFSIRPEFGVLGKDKPATPVRESVSYAVQIDKARKLVGLNFGVQSHASLVVGAAVASRGTAGRFDGVAPGAKLVNVAEGGSAYGQTEAVIIAVKHPEVDVVFLEQSSLIARNYLLFDGRLVPTVIYGRLIAKFKKPIVIPTHNYAVLAAIDDYALAPGAISVGGHESKANFMANHGVLVEHDDNLLITGGYGPMGNGAAKPDIIAPSNYVSTGRGFLEGTAIPGLMQLPPGYNIAGGTSTATPTTAGAVALLISAAKQSGVAWDSYKLRQALMTSARWVPHLPSYKQGSGVVNIAGAWEALKAMDTSRVGIAITSKAPVRHATSHLLAEPNVGVGLFEREGWAPGDSGTRIFTFTRTSGPRGAIPFALGWLGNDAGTYSSASSVTLPLNRSVDVPVRVKPAKAGVHTALLTLDYAGAPGVEFRTAATVVAARAIPTDSFMVKDSVSIPRPGMMHLYYRVPAGVSALKVEVNAPKRRPSVAIMRPDTRNISGIGGFGSPPPAAKQVYWITDPVPGTWEVRLQDVDDTRTFDWQQSKIDSAVPPSEATVTITALGADVSGSAIAGGGGSGGSGTEVSLSNSFGAFTGGAIGLAMGASQRERGQLAAREQRVFDIDVPSGSTLLTVRAKVAANGATGGTNGGTNGSEADLDLYLFNCTEKECVAARADGDTQGEETIVIHNPAAGKWKAVLDHSGLPSASVAFDYQDVVFNPAFGYVAVTDQPTERKQGATWSTLLNTWQATLPAGRNAFVGVGVLVQPKGGEPHLLRVVEVGGASERATEGGESR